MSLLSGKIGQEIRNTQIPKHERKPKTQKTNSEIVCLKPEFFLFSKNYILLSPVQVAVFWITGFNGFGFISVLGVWSFVIVLSGQQCEWGTDSTDDFPWPAVFSC